MSIKQFGLKNFRVFKEHFDFDLAPITVLTGPNNSGKSSVTKALLLIKENEDIINDDVPSTRYFSYYKGGHNLGNHKFTINTKGKNTVFSFTVNLNYKFCIELNEEGEYLYEYKLTTLENELIISQNSGDIKINVKNLIKFFRARLIAFTTDETLLSYKNDPDNEDLSIKNIEEFIYYLEEFGIKYDIIDIDLFDIFNLSQDEIDLKNRRTEKNPKLFNKVFDLESDIVSIDEDGIDLYWWLSLIYLFHEITNIELSKKEVLFLIPTSSSNFFQFINLVYIQTIKEPLKRAYSENDNLVFQSIIRKELNQDYLEKPLKFQKISKASDFDEMDYFERYNAFVQKWVSKFEIGKELTYGYDEANDIYYLKIDNKSLLEYGLGYGQIVYLLLALSSSINGSSFSIDKRIYFPDTYIIEEPETGLHPDFQSKIAEMIIDAHTTFDINFIIETHSEYFIRKLQYLTAKNELEPGEAVIYYFNNLLKVPQNEEQIKRIVIDKYGNLSDNFGSGFIDEGTTLKFDLLRLNRLQNN